MKTLIFPAMILALLVPAVVLGSTTDFAAIPPVPSEVHQKLDAMKMSLAEAVNLVQKEIGGLAMNAEVIDAPEGPLASILVYTEEKAYAVLVDLNTKKMGDKVEKPRFPGVPVSGEWTETASGLKFYDIVVGEGASPAGPTAQVTVHYSGWTVDGNQFDSSVERGEPITFALNRVIPGWGEGVGSMKVGGKRKLIIPSDLGYGDRGHPGVIPPGATLIFDVELLELPE